MRPTHSACCWPRHTSSPCAATSATGYTAADVIRLVAKLRSYSAEAAEAIDPVGAELVIKTALGAPSDPDAADDATKGNTEAGILMLLVADQQLSDEELDGFIADAVAQARKAR